MEAASFHRKDEARFNVSTKLQSAWSNAGGAKVHWGACPPANPSPLSKTVGNLHDRLSPMAAASAPTKNLRNWKRPTVVGAGLQNMGNTCYVNAALQCLTYTPPLASFMLSQRHSETCQMQRPCTLCTMQAHIIWALRSPGDVIQPLRELVTGFHRHKQEDAHEFLMFTVNAMQQACLHGYKQLDRHSEDTTLIRQIFGGYWQSQIKCLQCHGVSNTLDPYLDVILDIQEAQSVTHALELLVKPEKMDGENLYHCSFCLKKVPASKTLTLHTSSKVLIILLKRFSDFTGIKEEKAVQYPEHLDMQQYLSQQNAGPLVYSLYAVLVHAGWSCHNGHYFCYIKAGNGQWFKMDDAKVTACDISSALSQQAYVLFYIQKSELERDIGSVSLDVEPRCLGAEHTDMRATQQEPERHSSNRGPGSEEPKQKTSVKQITLQQWRLLQERSRPKPELYLRKIECALPANAFLIHQSKYRDGLTKNHPEQENYLLNNPARHTPPQEARNICQVPCPKGRARATKRKKKGQRSQDVFSA
ncbi:PREDICTED: ubiquitin carboxyl-terminal hydrolase 17-like protein 6 [Hipposideros armiger]|uniref:Ubiquitin carboxyl-terminal hydrolase n=1 Tax=Hipposideros armiger TaxID=186990 RepID=A0A8B7S3T4_HIPAR|nr:PREDICTED: ubiquitin carboxyl-terminal hydrolase 17-like protein 6 [Hipposideros armiger]